MSAPHDRPARSADTDVAAAIWRRRKWLGIAVSSAGIAAALSFVVSLPDLYTAAATVLVERQQVSEAFVRPSVTAELETRIQTIHQQIMSRARLADVITRLNLYPELRGVVPVNALVERMRHEVKLSLNGVEQMSGRTATVSFAVSHSGRDPATVAAVVNTLVAAYIEENTKSRERQAARTADFLKGQLDSARQEVDAQERRSGEFKQRFTAELPQQVEANLSALDRFNTQLRLNGEYQIRALERRERLEHELNAPPSLSSASIDDSPAVQLEKLQQQLAELRRKYSERYPDVIRVKAEINALESGMTRPAGTNGHSGTVGGGSARRVTAQTLSEVEQELEALKQEERMLRRVIATYEARVENAPKRGEELQLLSREFDSSKDRYDSLLKRYEDAQLAERLEQGQAVEQFRILDPAIPAVQPAAPNRLWLLLMGVLASLGLGFAAIIAAERLDTTFHSIDDLRGFGNVPTVAAIRRIPTRVEARQSRLRAALATGAVLLGITGIAAGVHHVASGNEQLVRMSIRGAQ